MMMSDASYKSLGLYFMLKYVDIQAWTPQATRSLKKRIVNGLCRFLVGGINNSGELQGVWNPNKSEGL